MNIQTRPISDLPEISRDSQTAQLMVYDEADKTPKKMPRSVMPVFIVVEINVPANSNPTLNSVSHTPDEVRALLKSNALVAAVFNCTDDASPTYKEYSFGAVLYYSEDDEFYGGLIIQSFATPLVIHAIDGSNTWEIGELPEKSST